MEEMTDDEFADAVKHMVEQRMNNAVPREALEMLATQDRGETVQLDGTRAVNTVELRRLALLAETRGFERTFTDEQFAALDPDGWHIVSARPELLPDHDPALTTRHQPFLDVDLPTSTHYSKTTRLNITLSSPLPCEVMVKLKNRSADAESISWMLDIRVMDFVALDTTSLKPIGFLWRTS